MTTTQLIRYRLRAQHLVRPYFAKPGAVVEWMGAVQAQDYLGALWSVGQRMKKSVEGDVEGAIANKEIVRSWPMRGTLHFVAPKDVRWMLKYLTPRVFVRIASILRQQEVDEKVIAKSTKALVKALEGGNRLTRPELYKALERAKISTSGTRGLHIILCVAQRGVICFGPRKDKQHTFALLDEWLPSFPVLPKEEAMAELAIRYFTSHGPATVEDFMWWAGMTKSGALESIHSAGQSLTQIKVGDTTYWLAPDAKAALAMKGIRLLPTYDEYGIGYKDRSTIISEADRHKVGGSYTSVLIDDGKAIGMWRRETRKNVVNVELAPFNKLTRDQRAGIEAEAARYGKFIGKRVELLM